MVCLRITRPRRIPFFAAASLLAASLHGADAGPRDELPIDFTTVGYAAGRHPPPAGVPSMISVAATGADDTALLQAALDHVSALPPANDGFRGAVLLEPGTFHVEGRLHVNASGVILRGSGASATRVVATGLSRRTLIEIGRTADVKLGRTARVVDEIAPAGCTALTLDNATGFVPGDAVVVIRPSTKEWIARLGMDKHEGNFANQRTDWLPGSRDLVWDRTVVAVDAPRSRIILDAPITTAFEAALGGGTVARVDSGGAVSRVGVEALTLQGAPDGVHAHDEEHAWIGIAVHHASDVWVRDVAARHFVGSAVRVGPRARRVSVLGCRALAPISEVGGYRRQSFLVEGQQVLVQDCLAEYGLNDFALGLCTAGPNAFQDCTAVHALGASGPFESWASGALYSRVRVEGPGLRFGLDESRAQGAGWTAANIYVVESSPLDPSIAQLSPPGAEVRVLPATPTALRRLGGTPPGAPPQANPPTPAPRPARFAPLKSARPAAAPIAPPLAIVGGRFVAGDRVIWGGQLNTAWWKGQVAPAIAASSSGRSITRWVPGRTGPGLTEDLVHLAADLRAAGQVFFASGPGLWYDRRRDDHLLHARPDGDVWAPFYEMPWARTGRGRAFDGLSQYDLTRFNPWYFQRTREFAKACEGAELVLFVSVYNTHNMLETLAHYVDYPWRPVNNTNTTGLAEPPPLDPGNTVHLAHQIYDSGHPARRDLHRALIRHHLDTLADCPNVILTAAFQFAGPLAFQQFFLDEVAAWERETGRDVKVALITSKDVTDAILADPARGRLVDVVDMRYWQRMADGRLWAPPGDRNLAFREMNAELFGKGVDIPPDSTPLEVYRMVRDYRDRFPDKAIAAWHGGAGQLPVLMAGGAQVHLRNPAAGQSQGAASDATVLDGFVQQELAAVLMRMTPRDGWLQDAERTWCLADDTGAHVLIAALGDASPVLARALPQPPSAALWFEVATGRRENASLPGRGEAGTTWTKPKAGEWLLYLRAEPR